MFLKIDAIYVHEKLQSPKVHHQIIHLLESIWSISPLWLYMLTIFFAYAGMCLSALPFTKITVVREEHEFIAHTGININSLQTFPFPTCGLHVNNFWLCGNLVSNVQILDPSVRPEPREPSLAQEIYDHFFLRRNLLSFLKFTSIWTKKSYYVEKKCN